MLSDTIKGIKIESLEPRRIFIWGSGKAKDFRAQKTNTPIRSISEV